MFPATYEMRPHESAAALVSQQLAAFRETFAHVDMSYARSKNLTPYDVLTIASMIEREARVPGDRAKVAAVIYNRLHRGMQLGHRRHDPLPPGLVDGDDPPVRPGRPRAVQHPHQPRACRRRRSAIPASPRSRRPRTRPTWTTCTTSPIPGKAAQYFTSSYEDFKAHGG